MSQFYAFLVCVLTGAAGGALYDVFRLIPVPKKPPFFRMIADGLFSLLFAAGYLAVSLLSGLPSLRFYTFLGCVAGFVLYLKSLHKFLAFITIKLYNKYNKRKTKYCFEGNEGYVQKERGAHR